MKLRIQPCAACADLHGRPASVAPHDDLGVRAPSVLDDPVVELRYACTQCGGVFACILAGPPEKQIWMLLNAGQH
ncbi:hypothetical protein B0G77_0357 [Paraburkholderia sp. BL10I2N1]|nr:hypothetical protein B0G77_0357 [Paraburkholderia sp. BL10I2N1]